MARAIKQLAALNDDITIDLPGEEACIGSVQLPTGWAGTVVVEAQINDTDWAPVGLTPAAGGAVVASVAAAGMWTFGPIAANKARARVSVAGAGGKVGFSVAPY